MKRKILPVICCPQCKNGLTLREDNVVNDEVIDGLFECKTCGKGFNISGSVPRMVLNPEARGNLADKWGYEWSKIVDGKLETETYYGGTIDEEVAGFFYYLGITPADLDGKTVLDAGCGGGRLTKELGKYGAYVVGIDIATSVDRIMNHDHPELNVDIIQADITAPPFPDASFEYVFCKLALNFVPDPAETFKTLSRLVKPGGKFFISLPDKADPAFSLRVKEKLRFTTRTPKWLLFYLCWALAPVFWFGRRLHKRPTNSLRTNVFLLFNAWHSSFTLHARQEIVGWFQEDEFDQITSVPDQHTVNVRGTKPVPAFDQAGRF
jgi:SAM-dependent methyltransferase